jgi:glycosyltransferase A (GT-A) superfamily protein (DUF2064 family)
LSNKTALLIFANSGQQEAFAKPFKSSALLFEELNAQTLKKVKASGLPYFHSSEKEQVGNSFAERFTNAIESIYARGFTNVISIGNDTPHLKTRHILFAVQQLETHDVVLGPSLDGGFYLMGLKKSQFNADKFLGLPWQTSQLSQSMYRLIQFKAIRLYKLEMLSDIDNVADLTSILQSEKQISSSLKIIVLHIISIVKKTEEFCLFHYNYSFPTSYFNKGSPRLIYV